MSKSTHTRLKLSLALFVIATVVSSTSVILMYQRIQDISAQLSKEKLETSTSKQLAQKAQKDAKVLKELLGKPSIENVGDPNTETQDDTVYWEVIADIRKFGGDRQDGTIVEALQDLHTQNVELNRKFQEFRDATEQRIKNLKLLTSSQAKLIVDMQKSAADRNVARIAWTSNDKRTVWIHFEGSDNILEGTTLCVYKKQPAGEVRTKEDVKGAIEVTKLLKPHVAEARVVRHNIYLPIQEGDHVDRPLRAPGISVLLLKLLQIVFGI